MPLYRDSIRFYDTLTANYPLEDAFFRERLAETLRDSARLHVKIGELREAKNSIDATLELTARLLRDKPDQAGYLQIKASSLLQLSAIESGLGGDAGVAKKHALNGVEIFEKLAQAPAEDQHQYTSLLFAGALNTLAIRQREIGEIKEALANHD